MSQFDSEPVRYPAGLGFDKGRLVRLKQWMQRYVDTGRWPGGAVLVARHGELAFFDCAGYADVEAKRPWQRDLIAPIYSMTKPVTAVQRHMDCRPDTAKALRMFLQTITALQSANDHGRNALEVLDQEVGWHRLLRIKPELESMVEDNEASPLALACFLRLLACENSRPISLMNIDTASSVSFWPSLIICATIRACRRLALKSLASYAGVALPSRII